MVMYSVGLVEKGDKNKGKMDNTMFTRTVFVAIKMKIFLKTCLTILGPKIYKIFFILASIKNTI